MRCRDGENVALPFTGGEALRGVQRILGRMGAAIHPDGALGAPGEVMRVDGDQLLRILIKLFPHADAGEAGNIIGRVNAALIFRQRDERCIPSIGAVARGIPDGDSEVIAQFGTGEAFGLIFVQKREIVPDASEVDLAKSGGVAEREQYGEQPDTAGHSEDSFHWTFLIWAPGDRPGRKNSVTHMIVYRSGRFVDWRARRDCGLGIGPWRALRAPHRRYLVHACDSEPRPLGSALYELPLTHVRGSEDTERSEPRPLGSGPQTAAYSCARFGGC